MNCRRLSQKAAWQCEYALNDRCRCRCAGKLHGAKRVDKSERLAELPAADPHYVARKRIIFMRDVFSASRSPAFSSSRLVPNCHVGMRSQKDRESEPQNPSPRTLSELPPRSAGRANRASDPFPRRTRKGCSTGRIRRKSLLLARLLPTLYAIRKSDSSEEDRRFKRCV